MSVGFFYLTFLLSGVFFVLGIEKLYYILVKKDNLYKKYDFTKSVVMGLSALDLFGAITVWFAYDLLGMLGLLAIGCSCFGSFVYNLLHKHPRPAILGFAGFLAVVAIFLEYLIIK